MAGPKVTLEFAGDSAQLEKAFDRVGASAKGMESDLSASSRRIGQSTNQAFDRVGEGFDTVDTRAMGFRDSLTGVQDTMVGTAALARGDLFTGLFMLGMGVGDLASGFYNFLIPAMKNFGGVAKIAAAGQALVNAVMNANPIFLVVTAVAALAAGLVIAYNKSETFRDIVDRAFDVVGKAVQWAWKNLIKPALDAFGDGLTWLWENVIQPVVGVIGDAFGWLADRIGLSADGSEQSVKKVGTSMQGTKEDADELTTAVDRLSESFDNLVQPVLDARDAERGFQEAIDAVTEAAKENGVTLDINTEAGRSNQAALDDLAEAAHRNVQALAENGAATDVVTGKMRTGRDAFINAAQAMGHSSAQANRLADELGLIPERVHVNVDADASYATRVVRDFRGELALIPREISVAVNAAKVGLPGGRERLSGLASGGPARRGQFAIVGEEGPELVQFSQSGWVFPADETRRMLNAVSTSGGTPTAGAAQSPAVLEIRSGGTALDDALVDLLRAAVRRQGGNVQDVLGA